LCAKLALPACIAHSDPAPRPLRLLLSHQAKEKDSDELTAGQASTLVRNEQVIDQSMAEMEDLEEALADSLRWEAWCVCVYNEELAQRVGRREQ
jgi:hypothetical protein